MSRSLSVLSISPQVTQSSLSLSLLEIIDYRIPAEIQCVDYREILLKAETNDIVYFDPPYDPVSYTSDFTAYTPDGFGRENQEQLAVILLFCLPRVIHTYSMFPQIYLIVLGINFV
jgi:site-specific DNA-adenine methylase